MGELATWIDTGGLGGGPPIDVRIADDGAGALHGTIAFTIHNSGGDAVTLTFDVLPGEGASASWFRVETDQFTVPANGYGSTNVFVTVPTDGMFGFDRYYFQGRVRSPGIAPAISEPGRFQRPLPPGWRLTSYPDTYLDLSFGRREISFSFHGPSADARLLFDIGAPDAESAGWFSVDQAVKGPNGFEPWDGTFTWRVNVDAEALIASGRPGVWLQPWVSVEQLVPPAPEWRPYAYWFGYGVEVGG